MKQETFTRPPDGDVDKGWAILAICWAFIACAFISTMLRVWVRSRITHNLGGDDYVAVAAMMTSLFGAGLITAEVLNGLGRHEYYLTSAQRRLFQVLGWADWIQTFITLALMKISICLFLLRIVDTKQVVRGMHVVISCITLFTAVSIFLFLGVCRPLRAYWDVGVNGACLSNHQVESVVLAQGILSIISDLILAALPAIFLRNLQIGLRTKVGLCLLMGLGVFTAVCCTVRTALSGSVTNPDLTWAATTGVGWRLPEVNIGIVCANAPVIRPLYLFFRGRLASQIRFNTGGVSKQSMWPSNTPRAAVSPGWRDESKETSVGDTSVSLEMGLHPHDDVQPQSPLKEKPYFIMGGGR
ncbi:hypothetical protein HO133_008236 [Letharia lupina]|uniref:Rhodopsin domain-containing protein n=2 Tax=Letharia TaxID=112415 RepID=A0A8H6CSI0_9LECA|nr:uncharacterized protein HO133_008236 [Letharia lupina]XP_037161539.1 uncharacterized protein HO173_009703 [Letharia columbiana]KAF6228506.1 hypothetical protein HO133_008236 [Letharia lupina]KAF6232109.1 hypothetical protein HO173_009703 [Letharia columbiana]